MTNRKVMTSVKLQKMVHFRLQQQVIADGYGMRGKSQWIIEAIEDLLTFPDYPDLVHIAEDMDHLDIILSFRLPETLAIRIDKSVTFIRRQYPSIEGVRSNLIRASIMQRLLRTTTSVTEVDHKHMNNNIFL